MVETVKGFKVFNPDWTCRGFKYEVGKIYEEDVTPSICDRGFHFCKRVEDCFNYYKFDPDNKVAEVIALGVVAEEGNKCSTNKIRIVREITWNEVLAIVNTGKACTGLGNSGNLNSGIRNSGNRNSGNYNSGDYNSGNYNSGDYNSGNRNSGNLNSGNRNSGNYNSGDYNSGIRNSGIRNSGNRNSGNRNNGDYNSGNYNSGDYNSGNLNSGIRNSGNRNSGNYNSGDYNSGDWNKASNVVGCFNTKDQKLMFFDKETNMTLEQWRRSEANELMSWINFRPTDWILSSEMSDVEKTEHPEYETTGGYLKIRDNADCCKEWWGSLSKDEKQVIMNIPNFDADKFFEITGIKVRRFNAVARTSKGTKRKEVGTVKEWKKNLTKDEKYILLWLEDGMELRRDMFDKNTDRKLRKIIARLRRYVPIINLQDGRGYYIPTDEQEKEAEKYYWQEYRRAMSILVRLKPLRTWLATRGQTDLGIEYWESEGEEK